MLRFNKPVKIMEWGLGTNTNNQVWTEIAEGSFVSKQTKNGITTVIVQTKQGLQRKNLESDSVKLCQQGEGMTACSERWGEVSMGNIKSVSGNSVTIEISHAVKISGGANLLERFLGLP